MSREILTKLPEDIIHLIATHSDIADVLALRQTCRRLNRLADSDYLWHQLLPREDLPLDLSPFVDLRSFSTSDIQSSALRALKLRYNWSRKTPQVRSVHVANPNSRSFDSVLDELKVLNGGTILLGVHRDRHSQRPFMVVSAYNLIDVKQPHLAAHLAIPVSMKDFDACLAADGMTLILAATVTKDDTEVGRVLEVYSILLPLDSPTVCNGLYDLAYSFVLNEGLFHKVSLHGDYIASSILDHAFPEGWQSPQVLVANWKTRQQITISPRFTDNIDQMDIKVLPPYLSIVAASTENAQVTLAPLSVLEYGSVLEQPVRSKAKQRDLPYFSHATVPIMDFYDICISDNGGYGPYVPPTSISLIVFPTLSRLDVRQSKKALLLRFTICQFFSIPEANARSTTCGKSINARDPSLQLESSIPFDIPVGSYPEYPCLGTTGRRGVWLEQSLKSDYVQILRLDYDPVTNQPPSLNVLLPPEPQLPFKPSSCRALAFDEATARLCIGLYNGLIYVLDYV
ncbi:hypothetical protein ACEPAH_8208 [Sanghuangporus vaninii]